jgi:hypothetical protein
LGVEPRGLDSLLIKSKATLEIENNPSAALIAEILALAVS